MKKLRMVITSVIVLAIVCSAFAFKVKSDTFCVLAYSASGTDCTTYIQNVQRDPLGATQYKYFAAWNGNKILCTLANNGLCIDSILTVVGD
jgi:hypothetical protein